MREAIHNTWVRVGDAHVVHNGSSGAVARLNDDEKHAVDRFLGGDASFEPGTHEALLEALIRAQILVADRMDEVGALRRRFDAARLDPTSLRLTVVTSLGCNFACPYCFEAKEASRLRPDVADAIVARVAERPALRSLFTTWFGGEPLLAQPQLYALADRLIEHCDRHDIVYSASIVTNGWHLDGATAAALARRRVARAQVTLDGPAEIHNVRRPHAGGSPTFDRIVANLKAAAEHLKVNVRVNIDQDNLESSSALLMTLADEGLAHKVSVSPARLLPDASNPASPLASYRGCGVPKGDFADFELEFEAQARVLGFKVRGLPQPIATPCTAVNQNDLVIGAAGELWKCWDDVGDNTKAFGTIFDERLDDRNRLEYLSYDPFEDEQCRSCTALPGCMGGCAHLAMHTSDRDSQCSTFRFNRRARIEVEARLATGAPPASLLPAGPGRTVPGRRRPAPVPVRVERRVPVALGPRRIVP